MEGQSVQDLFPTVDLAGQVLPILLPGNRHEIEHFHRCLLGREMASMPDCQPKPGVERLNRIRRVHDLSELDRELEERNELVPRGLEHVPGLVEVVRR